MILKNLNMSTTSPIPNPCFHHSSHFNQFPILRHSYPSQCSIFKIPYQFVIKLLSHILAQYSSYPDFTDSLTDPSSFVGTSINIPVLIPDSNQIFIPGAHECQLSGTKIQSLMGWVSKTTLNPKDLNKTIYPTKFFFVEFILKYYSWSWFCNNLIEQNFAYMLLVSYL